MDPEFIHGSSDAINDAFCITLDAIQEVLHIRISKFTLLFFIVNNVDEVLTYLQTYVIMYIGTTYMYSRICFLM